MAELRPYSPSLREWIAEQASKAIGMGDETRNTARAGRKVAEGLDLILGPATYGHDAARSASRGDYLGAAGNVGMAALSLPFIPAFSKTATLLGRSPYAPIPGTPKQFTLPSGESVEAMPIEGVVDAAKAYMKSRGGGHTTPSAFTAIDPERAKAIASAYGNAVDAPTRPEVAGAFAQMADETRGQYRALKDAGYDFRFMPRDEAGNVVDPYAESPALGYLDMLNNRRLQIFPTDAGFGSITEASAANPLLRQSGEMFGDQPATYNDLFRAVHDAFGHYGYGNAFFRAPGEERAWQLHSMMYSPEARRAMTSETRGQNSWVNFGPHAEHNATASGADTVYADQKTTLLPDWVSTAGLPAARKDGAFIPAPVAVVPGPGAFAEDY